MTTNKCDDFIFNNRKMIMILVDGKDYFDKKYIYVQYIKKKYISKLYPIPMDIFPNALMIENTLFNKEGSLFENSSPTYNSDIISTHRNDTDKKPNTNIEDVWDILNQLKNSSEENNSPKHISKNICTSCGAKDSLFEDIYKSVITCLTCGMVNDERLDHAPEWRQYNNDDNRAEVNNRCGGPSNYFFPHSSQGTIIAGYANNRIIKKQKWNGMVYKERKLIKDFDEITQICLSAGISKSIIDTAKIIYNQICDCKHLTGKHIGDSIITRGVNRTSVMAICVKKACETNKEPRNNEEISTMFGICQTSLTKGNNKFDEISKNCNDSYVFDQIHASTPEDYIRCYCKKLNISKIDTELAVKISNNCSKMKLATDHNAQSIAAGSILTMIEHTNLDINKKDLAKLSKISDITISKIYIKLIPYIDVLIDDDLTNHIIIKFRING